MLTLRRKQKTNSVFQCIPTANVKGEKSWKATGFAHFCILLLWRSFQLMCFATTNLEEVSDHIRC